MKFWSTVFLQCLECSNELEVYYRPKNSDQHCRQQENMYIHIRHFYWVEPKNIYNASESYFFLFFEWTELHTIFDPRFFFNLTFPSIWKSGLGPRPVNDIYIMFFGSPVTFNAKISKMSCVFWKILTICASRVLYNSKVL